MSHARNVRKKNRRRIRLFGICIECKFPFKGKFGRMYFRKGYVHWDCIPTDVTLTHQEIQDWTNNFTCDCGEYPHHELCGILQDYPEFKL